MNTSAQQSENHKPRRIFYRYTLIAGIVLVGLLVVGWAFEIRPRQQRRQMAELIQAVRNGQSVRRLLESGTPANIYFDPNTFEPICAAPLSDYLHLNGKRRNTKGKPDHAPLLSFAIAYFHNEIASDIIRYNGENLAYLQAPDGKGSTPLHYAAQSNNQSILIDLLEKHADPNLRNSQGNTPLQLTLTSAVEESTRQIAPNIALLLEHGANPNIANNQGTKPLDIVADKCVRLHKKWIDETLENLASKHPIEPDKITRNFQHQLDMRRGIVQLLRKYGAKGSDETERLLDKSLILDHQEILDLLKPDPNTNH